ncbi:unnamed protein product [Rotaria magnacalcarata]|uniref:Uncharacterized protein n=1 Tax=Rotaria magnacalcarata TaxID=392030 RepID=A0A816QUF0_9BILA|nr:unnamed protein product [Rotaria magnacalcarata]CAF1541400.1 unnamed protein product [Rotaria magnacalcarata]CAF2063321.1 unnamed protein product [Rotaria magnacalcarata]CAF2126714.1 unnamed protein product [Rotaria magnacalcarata]CAF2171314.1 unnamed protein product [Rotaria magnacalcarata]
MSSNSLIFVWLDKRMGYLPGGNEKLKDKFRKILSPLRQFDKPTACYDFLQDSTKDKKVFFLTTNIFAEEDFLRQIALLKSVHFIYIYDQENKPFTTNDKNLLEKMGSKRLIHFDEILYEQLIYDLIQLYKNQAEQLVKDKQNKEAKQLFEYSLQLIDTVEEHNQDLQTIQQDLFEKIQQIK